VVSPQQTIVAFVYGSSSANLNRFAIAVVRDGRDVNCVGRRVLAMHRLSEGAVPSKTAPAFIWRVKAHPFRIAIGCNHFRDTRTIEECTEAVASRYATSYRSSPRLGLTLGILAYNCVCRKACDTIPTTCHHYPVPFLHRKPPV
jgi:hypothetical protein